ncbi:MAG: pyruvate, phosphate dikinase [Deltaproteobacteria bacterium]|nr:pyruvate, phosphate dikinase [Deltaproteobacteria bacterium]
MPEKKYIYFFGRGKADGNNNMKETLGGKGSGLAEMTNIGLPVPAGFTLTTDVCDYYCKNGNTYPEGLEKAVQENLEKLESITGKKFGDPNDPLLVSVRSGAARSMPGMMETILNLGLNNTSVEGLAKKTTNRRFALDAYRRFITMYSSTAMGIPRVVFDEAFGELKERYTKSRLKIRTRKVIDTDVNEEELCRLIPIYKEIYREHAKKDFPEDPRVQLWGAINAVIRSWMAEKAVTYRRVEKITGLLGTAVNIVQMVFGNKGDDSGTGVCFTRDPNTGENIFYGDMLMNAQGEDVVAGIRTPLHLGDLKNYMPAIYDQLLSVRDKLERHYKDMQDIEFTIEEGRLYILQTRTGKRSPRAAFEIAVDLVKEGLITKKDALLRITSKDIEGLFYPVIDPKIPEDELKRNFFAAGIAAVPGAAAGHIVFTARDAEEMATEGKNVVLVRRETNPEDVGGMHAAVGILTQTGGKTSHAAVVARGWGKCCVVGCEDLTIDYDAKTVSIGNTDLKEGDEITINGTTGEVYKGAMPLIKPSLPDSYSTLMEWADEARTLKVRTNVDTPYDAENAVRLGAEGIGLCRTEHMFFDTDERRLAIQKMILADTSDARKKALEEILPVQRIDFIGIFRAMDDKPVTIRLLDPPLHEFVPHTEEEQKHLAQRLGLQFSDVKRRIDRLHEANPMLGHRGCRLCISYPEILDMQVRAIMEAACESKKKGIRVHPEIMHPLIMDAQEFSILETKTRDIASRVMKEKGIEVGFLVGTMIEVPRAALLADKIAEHAEFFSFGTNDLTQMTLGMSRDDAGRFIAEYVDEKKAAIFKDDPFQSLDQEGVGLLIRIAIEKGLKTRPGLKIGICGEHGGDPSTVEFCYNNNFDYVSCSPFRVPIARLAAAQASIRSKKN